MLIFVFHSLTFLKLISMYYRCKPLTGRKIKEGFNFFPRLQLFYSLASYFALSLIFHFYYIYRSLYTHKPAYITLRPVFGRPWALTSPSSLASVIPVDCCQSSLSALHLCSCPPAHYLPHGCQNALLQTRISCPIIHIKPLVGLNCPPCNYKTL